MHASTIAPQTTFQAILPLLGASTAFAALLGVVLAFGAVTMAML